MKEKDKALLLRLQSTSIVKRILLILVAAILIGTITEVIRASLQYFKADDSKGRIKIEESDISLNAVQKSNGKFKTSEKGGTITVDLNDKFVDKFVYYYDSDIQFDNEVTIIYKNILGVEAEKKLHDGGRKDLTRSVINIGKKVSTISIHISGDHGQFLQITGFEMDNTFKVNPIRIFIGFTISFIALFLLFCKKDYKIKVEVAFLALAFPIGLLFLIAQPPHLNGWDEYIHFSRCYNEALGEDAELSGAVKFLYENPEAMPFKPVQSIEERYDEIQLLNEMDNVKLKEHIESADLGIKKVGYVFQIGAFKIGYALGLPFSLILLMARFTNLILYCVVVFFAIRKLPLGKHLMMITALIPTTLFLTSTLTYDTTVNAFLFLASAILISALCRTEEKISIPDQIGFIVCMVIASCPKAIYIPLLLLGLFIPAKKFETKRQMNIFKSLILVGFLGMMSTFILPMLVSPGNATDLRGGTDVNSGMQFKLILTHPIAYAKVLLGNLINSNISTFFIENTIGNFAYSDLIKYPLPELVLLTVVTISDTYVFRKKEEVVCRLNPRMKGIIFTVILFTSCLIWTGLYISFTEVGEVAIQGVQGRYFLSLFFLLFLIIQPKNILAKIPRSRYQLAIFGSSAAILIYSVYDSMIRFTGL